MYVWFVCVGFFFPLKNCSSIWRRHYCRWGAANCDLYCAVRVLYACHTYCYKGYLFHIGHLRGPLILRNTGAKGLHVPAKVSLSVLTTYDCRCWDSNIQLYACEAYSPTEYVTIPAYTTHTFHDKSICSCRLTLSSNFLLNNNFWSI